MQLVVYLAPFLIKGLLSLLILVSVRRKSRGGDNKEEMHSKQLVHTVRPRKKCLFPVMVRKKRVGSSV